MIFSDFIYSIEKLSVMSVSGSGLSVSVPSSPRTPQVSYPRTPRIEEIGLAAAPFKKKREEAHEESHEEASISPRVLFPSSVARRLEFYSSGEWSPIPLPSSSSPSVAPASVASWEAAHPIMVERMDTEDTVGMDTEDTVGECNVCYMVLPPRSNHVFTPCGHLFCVKCMLLWWDTTTTCAMCRG